MKTSYFKIAMKIGAGLVVGKYFGRVIVDTVEYTAYKVLCLLADKWPDTMKEVIDDTNDMRRVQKGEHPDNLE